MLANSLYTDRFGKSIGEKARSYKGPAFRSLAGLPWLVAATVIVRTTALMENFPIISMR